MFDSTLKSIFKNDLYKFCFQRFVSSQNWTNSYNSFFKIIVFQDYILSNRVYTFKICKCSFYHTFYNKATNEPDKYLDFLNTGKQWQNDCRLVFVSKVAILSNCASSKYKRNCNTETKLSRAHDRIKIYHCICNTKTSATILKTVLSFVIYDATQQLLLYSFVSINEIRWMRCIANYEQLAGIFKTYLHY